ncbi:MAG: CpcT/CpeT family chromophore lyase [Rhodanobacter sp.]
MNMFLRSIAMIGAVLTISHAAVAQGASETVGTTGDLKQSLARFLQWALGASDNNEQVWQEDLDKAAKPHRHSHVVVVDAHASAIGPNTLFVQQDETGKPGVAPKLNLLSVSVDPAAHAIRLDVYAFVNAAKYGGAYAKPALLAAITSADVVRKRGCLVVVTDQGDHFAGAIGPDGCPVRPGKDQHQVVVNGTLRLSASGLWLQDEGRDVHGKQVLRPSGGVPSKNRHVRYYSGWTIVKKSGPAAALDDQAMWSMVHFVIHNEGQIVPIKDDKSGKDTGYSLQLAQLTYQNTCDPVFKLGLIENKSGRTVAYSWASDAKQVGTNLRWFQAGATQRSGDAGKFGFIQTK